MGDMTRYLSRRKALGQGALLTTVGISGCIDSLTEPSSTEQVREHENSLNELSDISTVISKGYRISGSYIQTEDGVLGIPFVNHNITDLDPERPQIVLFNLTEKGQYEPIGLKWFAPTNTYDSPPTLFGKEFEGPRTSKIESISDHYALHLWLFSEDSEGLFKTYNSNIQPPELVNQIKPVWENLNKYLLGEEAIQAGYKNTEKCISMDDGTFGIPFIKTDSDGKGSTNPENPPILMYRVTSNWTYHLMGAEWYLPVTDQDSPPSLFGQRFHDPLPGHSPKTNQSEHYGLHAWLFRANPRGMFSPLNPTVDC